MVHPGDREYQAGALFVALSRATCLSGLCVAECGIERLLKIGQAKQFLFRMLEEVRLRDLARRHLENNFENLVEFCSKHGITVSNGFRDKVAKYRSDVNCLDKLHLEDELTVTQPCQNKIKKR